MTSVIFGARSMGQLEENLAGGEVKLTEAEMKRLDDASAFEWGYPYDFMLRFGPRW